MNLIINIYKSLGDSGHNLVEWIRFLLGRDLDFPHLKIIFPTAPVQKYSLYGGQVKLLLYQYMYI